MLVVKHQLVISNLTKFLNDLNQAIGQATIPVVEGIENKKIEISPGADEGFIVTYVPRSELRPHRAQLAGREYYRRSGSSFYRMEHWEIVEMITRQQLPNVELEFAYKWLTKISERHLYQLIIKIINKGNIMVKHFCIKLQIPKVIPLNFKDFEKEYINDEIILTLKGNMLPLFPKESETITGSGSNPSKPFLEYEVTDETVDYLNQAELKWTIYADNMPPKSGKIPFSKLHCF